MKIKLLLILLVLTAALTACGNNNNDNNNTASPAPTVALASQVTAQPEVNLPAPAPTPAAVDDNRVLTLGIWAGNDAEWTALERVRQDFEAQFGIKIEWHFYTDLNAQVMADLNAGTAPDAFHVSTGVAEQLVYMDLLKPLDRNVFNTTAFFPNVLDTFVFNGTVYAIPKHQSSLARYVNTDLLATVGKTVSDIPNDLEGYLEFLPRLQAELDAFFGEGQVWAASGIYEPERSLHLLNRTVNPFNPDGTSNMGHADVIRHAEFIVSLFETGAMRTPQMMNAGWNGDAFGRGLVVIMEEGNWIYSRLRNGFPEINFQVIPMPTYQGQRSGMTYTVGWGINANSPNADLATTWIQYKTGPEGMYNWCVAAGFLPTRLDVAAGMVASLSAGLNVHIDQIPYSTPWVMGRFSSFISDSFMYYMSAAVSGEISVKEALTNAENTANMQILHMR